MNQILKENDASIFGKYISHLMYKTPKRALQMLSYYKFVANFIPPGKKILEIGCNEGFGTWLLSKNASSVTAVDFDKDAIETAKTLWKDPKLDKLKASKAVIYLSDIRELHSSYWEPQ